MILAIILLAVPPQDLNSRSGKIVSIHQKHHYDSFSQAQRI